MKKTDKEKYKKLMKVSYGTKVKNLPEGLHKDKKLSGKRVSVLTNSDHSKNYVVHRGTASLKDWQTDMQMALGYEGGNRFKHAEKIQKKAESKYGAKNITTVGHSLGGRLAEKYGKKSKEIVTFNKAVTPRSIYESYTHPQHNQLDIRTRNDPVSSLNSIQKGSKKRTTTLEGTSNPVDTHVLKSLK